MADIEEWLGMYRSKNPIVRLRAASALTARGDDVPTDVLLDIYGRFAMEGLGAALKKTLVKRRDESVFEYFMKELASADVVARYSACEFLGKFGDPRAVPKLVVMLDDSAVMVRRNAAYALGSLGDRSVVPVLEQQVAKRSNDDINVRFALRSALVSLGASPPSST